MLMACAPATVDPAQFSPDGHRLAFSISQSADPATVPPATRLGLLDWSSQTSGIPDGLDERVSLNAGALCWPESDGGLHIGGFFGTDIQTTRWFQLDPESSLPDHGARRGTLAAGHWAFCLDLAG